MPFCVNLLVYLVLHLRLGMKVEEMQTFWNVIYFVQDIVLCIFYWHTLCDCKPFAVLPRFKLKAGWSCDRVVLDFSYGATYFSAWLASSSVCSCATSSTSFSVELNDTRTTAMLSGVWRQSNWLEFYHLFKICPWLWCHTVYMCGQIVVYK